MLFAERVLPEHPDELSLSGFELSCSSIIARILLHPILPVRGENPPAEGREIPAMAQYQSTEDMKHGRADKIPTDQPGRPAMASQARNGTARGDADFSLFHAFQPVRRRGHASIR